MMAARARVLVQRDGRTRCAPGHARWSPRTWPADNGAAGGRAVWCHAGRHQAARQRPGASALAAPDERVRADAAASRLARLLGVELLLAQGDSGRHSAAGCGRRVGRCPRTAGRAELFLCRPGAGAAQRADAAWQVTPPPKADVAAWPRTDSGSADLGGRTTRAMPRPGSCCPDAYAAQGRTLELHPGPGRDQRCAAELHAALEPLQNGAGVGAQGRCGHRPL
jgi:hypothetical protein